MVGLKKGDYKRNCPQHDVCGESLRQGDLIVLRRCIIGMGLNLEAVVKTDENGVDSCTFGFIAKDLAAFGFAKYEGFESPTLTFDYYTLTVLLCQSKGPNSLVFFDFFSSFFFSTSLKHD